MTTPPTPCRPRPCTTAISPRCSPPAARSTPFTIRRRASPVRRRTLSQETPFPGNNIPTNRFDKVGAAILSLLPDHREDAGRSTRPVSNYQDATTAEKAKYYN